MYSRQQQLVQQWRAEWEQERVEELKQQFERVQKEEQKRVEELKQQFEREEKEQRELMFVEFLFRYFLGNKNFSFEMKLRISFLVKSDITIN